MRNYSALVFLFEVFALAFAMSSCSGDSKKSSSTAFVTGTGTTTGTATGTSTRTTTGSAGTVTENSATVGRYDIYELTLTHTWSYTNPWEDVSIATVFTAPSSKTYSVGGFYYDTDTWKIRFAPMEEGVWAWKLSFDNGSGTYAYSGDFTCVASTNKGFLRIHPQNPYRFITDGNSTVFYPIGFNVGVQDFWDAVSRSEKPLPADGSLSHDWVLDEDWEASKGHSNPVTIDLFFDTFDSAGSNIFRFNTSTDTYHLYNQLNINNTGKNSYLVLEGKLTDQLVEKLHQLDWKFFMVFWGWAMPEWYSRSSDIADPAKQQAILGYHKYVIDRWGAYMDVWDMINERNCCDEYLNTVGNFVRSHDPYDHLISTSWQRPDLAVIEVNSPHLYYNTDTLDIDGSLANTLRSSKNAHTKPILYGEFGNSYPPYPSYAPNRYRIFLWTSMFNEGAICFWYQANKDYQAIAANMYMGLDQREYSKIMSDFIADFDVMARPISVTLNPSSKIRAHALGSSKDIGIYFTHCTSHTTTLSGATVTIDIPQNGMDGYWLDPVSGNTLQTFTIDSGSRTLTVPDFEIDVVLRIR